MTSKNAVGIPITIGWIVSAIVILLLSDPVAQDPGYHQFSDSRTLWHIPNFWNVLSNIPFSLVGIWGSIQLREPNQLVIVRENRLAYSLFSTSLLLVFAGSTYYHLDPGNATLVWDRLPMTEVWDTKHIDAWFHVGVLLCGYIFLHHAIVHDQAGSIGRTVPETSLGMTISRLGSLAVSKAKPQDKS